MRRLHIKIEKPPGGVVVLLVFIFFLLSGCGDEDSFVIVVLSDTQYYSESHPELFLEQTRWIKQNKEKLNIVFVAHEGDITDNNIEEEWKVADDAMSLLDDSIPYSLAVGNHDMGPGGNAENRDVSLFHKYFPVLRYEKKPWYGGNFEGTLANAYYFFEAAGMKFMVLSLEFGPRDETLEWANNVVAAHKDYRTIVVTHCYLDNSDKRVGNDMTLTPDKYGVGGNNGIQIWEKFVRKHENIFLVLSGHIYFEEASRLSSKGDHGNIVHEVRANYQRKDIRWEGWLRIMEFHPRSNRILVKTYSPHLDRYWDDKKNQFRLKYKMGE